MTKSKSIAVAIAALFLLAGGLPGDTDAWAQKAGNARGKGWEKKRDKIRKKIRTMRAWRLTEALDLDEKTAGKLFPIINEYDEKFAKLTKKARKTRRKLKKQLESKSPDRKSLDRLIDAVEEHHKANYEWQRDRFKAVRKVLTPAQSATIVVLLPKLDRQIRQEIRKAMRGAKDRRERRRNREFKDPF